MTAILAIRSTVAADWLSPTTAIVVATIAGAFSYLGLVLSKEQKVSEFRQAWIDGLREDLAALISAVFVMKYLDDVYEYEPNEQDSLEVGKPNLPEASRQLLDFAKAMSESQMEAGAAFHRILLRLNPDDKNIVHKELIAQLTRMRDFFVAGEYERATSCASAIQEKGRLVLKPEWIRVKRGELTFRLSKYIALFLLLAAIGVTAFLAFETRHSASTPARATPSPQYDIRPQQNSSPIVPGGSPGRFPD
jgi:hypothetical protein